MNVTTKSYPGALRAPFAWLAACLLACTCVAWSAPAEAQAATAAESETQAASGVVNLNTATEEQLTKLPGIGPSKARAILDARERLGRFRHVRQIVRVRGIGRATYRKLRPMLTLEGQTTLE